jgi:hypothetical protein
MAIVLKHLLVCHANITRFIVLPKWAEDAVRQFDALLAIESMLGVVGASKGVMPRLLKRRGVWGDPAPHHRSPK